MNFVALAAVIFNKTFYSSQILEISHFGQSETNKSDGDSNGLKSVEIRVDMWQCRTACRSSFYLQRKSCSMAKLGMFSILS